jgi:hypothetical protein
VGLKPLPPRAEARPGRSAFPQSGIEEGPSNLAPTEPRGRSLRPGR